MDIKRFVMLAFGLAVIAVPAKADTIKSEDASVELTVPNGWRQTKPIAPAIRIQATNGRATILVRIAVKEDYKDLKSFAQVASSKFIKHLVDAEFVEVVGIANASAFSSEQQTMADMAAKVKVLAAAGVTPTPAASTTPPTASPPSTTPSGKQPPPSRSPR
jgi:hypothetical protein